MQEGKIQLLDENAETKQFKSAEQWTNIKEIAGGENYLIGITNDGNLCTAGIKVSNSNEQITALCASGNNILGITEDGTVKVLSSEERAVKKGMMQVENWTNVKQIVMGSNHTVGLSEDGTVWATGDNHNGQCNVEDWTNVVYIIAGKNCTLGMTADGDLLVAGELD